MKRSISGLALAAALCSLAATAYAQPSGGPDAKGNAPLKAAHTVNDGAAKPGANSFTEGQARQHIAKAGFANVSGLSKGPDGVWRGNAVKNGQTMGVAMDFKGNVTTAAAPASSAPAAESMTGATSSGRQGAMDSSTTTAAATAPAAPAGARHVRHHRHHRRHHGSGRCAAALRDGAACSGVDANGNGISDKEDRALSH